ncbi:MAG: LysR family transcriptional regulator, partial [Clostridiales bacterium]|nr:LysR family transcriptional regulator [Clostridiales bacterium]
IRQNDGIVGKQLEGDKPVPICIAWTKDSWKQEEVQQFIKEIMKFYGAVR